MKKYPIIIFAVIILGMVCIAGYRYKDYVIDRNFILSVNTICDADSEACFDPETDYSFDEFPYKKIEIIAKNAPSCLEEHTCESFSCDNLEGCIVIYCSDETKWEGELCLKESSSVPIQGDQVDQQAGLEGGPTVAAPDVIVEDNI